MSTTYEIYKFAKPTLKELSIVDYYSDYDVFSILDEDGDSTGEFISLFRIDDKSVSNIVDSRFVRKLELPEYVRIIVCSKCIDAILDICDAITIDN